MGKLCNLGKIQIFQDTEDELEAEKQKVEAEAAEILKQANAEQPEAPEEPKESENTEENGSVSRKVSVTETVDSDGETVNGVIKIEGSVPEEIPAEPEPEPEAPPEPEIPEEPILPVKPVMVSIATDTLDLEANTEDTSPTEPQIESPSTSCDIDTEVKVMKEESTQTETIGT